MKTKDRILEKALFLFNEKGAEAVTTRQIALALEMSQGNLCYHFAKKEAIIHALYQQLVGKFDVLFEKITSIEPSFQLVLELVKIVNQQFVDYKFLMLNFAQIMRQYPNIQTHYQQLTQQRNQQTLLLFHFFEQQGILKTEAYTGQYLQIIEQLTILSNFWLSHAEILYQGDKEAILPYYNRLILSFYYPYLTSKGQMEYEKLDF